MITRNSRSNLNYLNKLVDQYNNNYHQSKGKMVAPKVGQKKYFILILRGKLIFGRIELRIQTEKK